MDFHSQRNEPISSTPHLDEPLSQILHLFARTRQKADWKSSTKQKKCAEVRTEYAAFPSSETGTLHIRHLKSNYHNLLHNTSIERGIHLSAEGTLDQSCRPGDVSESESSIWISKNAGQYRLYSKQEKKLSTHPPRPNARVEIEHGTYQTQSLSSTKANARLKPDERGVSTNSSCLFDSRWFSS